MSEKHCKHCGKVLVKRDNEEERRFRVRLHCDRLCAMRRGQKMALVVLAERRKCQPS